VKWLFWPSSKASDCGGNPALNLTISWTDSDTTKDHFGETWTNGETKQLCPQTYICNAGKERWSIYDNFDALDLYKGYIYNQIPATDFSNFIVAQFALRGIYDPYHTTHQPSYYSNMFLRMGQAYRDTAPYFFSNTPTSNYVSAKWRTAGELSAGYRTYTSSIYLDSNLRNEVLYGNVTSSLGVTMSWEPVNRGEFGC